MKLELKDAYPLLKERLESNSLNIFVGSGISLDSGIPSWDDLVIRFLDMAKSIRFVNDVDKNEIEEIVKDAYARKSAHRFNPIEIATVLKNRLKRSNELTKMPFSQASKDYKNWVGSTFDKAPNLKHQLIVATDYAFILTSNYDTLLQTAAFDLGYKEFSGKIFSYKNQSEILHAINVKDSCMVHVHGVANSLELDDLIFTKEDYNKIILKKYEGFSFALRMLFTRYSTLFVGYGASDPHLDEILEELAEYFPLVDDSFVLPTSYLVTRRDKADVIMEKYKERVGMHLILIDDFAQYIDLLEFLKGIKPRT